ncbi:MAG: hypothetical protein V4597_18465 [Pseudomonadota bacterium]
MRLAWGLYRAELSGPSPRTFADALAGSWRWYKRGATRSASAPAWVKGRPAHVSFGSMLQSPIRRSLAGKAYANTTAARLGYVTSMVGR